MSIQLIIAFHFSLLIIVCQEWSMCDIYTGIEGKNMEITYVTGNWAKVLSAKMFFDPIGIKINNIKIDCPEIQADTFEKVAGYSAKYASDKLKCNVIKNDSGLVIPALKGFPGVYTHPVEDMLGEDGILKLMEGITDRRAYFVECIAYCPYGGEPVTFTARTYGTIACAKSGTHGWSWDYIFVPDGVDKTLANYEDEERLKMWSTDALASLADYLNKSNF